MARPETDKSPARQLREGFRMAERDAARLRLLQESAAALAHSSDLKQALQAALMQATRFLAVDAGAVLKLESGGLTVQATQGLALPAGARLAATGVLAEALRTPLQMRERAMSSVRVPPGPVAMEVLITLLAQGEAVGVLILNSSRAVALPDAEDMVTLQALATLLAASLGKRASARPTRANKREATQSMARLTPREQQVLALLPRGLSNAELARELGVAVGTAKIHVERILHKLGVRDRTQAAVRAAEWGLAR